MGSVTREETHEALASLNDNMALSHAAIVAHFPDVRALPDVNARANAMRSLLLQAIEVLRPPRRLPFGSLASRSYDVLTLRYVGSKSVAEVCEEFGLGRRQIHRDLTQAEEKIAAILDERLSALAADVGAAPTEASGSEPAVLPLESVRVRLEEVMQATGALLRPLADQFSVSVAYAWSPERVTLVLADVAVLKQILVQFVSSAIQAATERKVTLAVDEEGDDAVAVVRFATRPSRLNLERLLRAQSIAASHHIPCRLELEDADAAEVRLRLRRTAPLRLLVVEDNASAIELYRRYLPANDWEVHGVADPRFALEVARSLAPDAVILDIMLPKMDGWSVLSLFAGRPETAAIPVIVCSVVEDADLARALGARLCLKKPVSRAELLAALSRCVAAARP